MAMSSRCENGACWLHRQEGRRPGGAVKKAAAEEDRSHPFAGFAPGSAAMVRLDTTAKEWVGMGRTDALFFGP